MRFCRTWLISPLILPLSTVLALAAQPPASGQVPGRQPGAVPAAAPGQPGFQNPGAGRPPVPGQTQPQRPPQPPPPKADAAATKLFEQAVAKVDLNAVKSLEMNLWSQMHIQGLTLTSSGRYVVALNNLVHIDLKVDLGDVRGRMEVFGDGKTLWETFRMNDDPKIVASRKVVLTDVQADLKKDKIDDRVWLSYIENQAFAGLAPLMSALKERLVFTKMERDVQWQGHSTVRLTGAWAPNPNNVPENSPHMPQRCDVYLNTQTLWPERIEFWGNEPPKPGESLLFEMEFRDPVLGRTVPASEFAFTPPAGIDEKKADQTATQIALIKQQLHPGKQPPAAPPGGGP